MQPKTPSRFSVYTAFLQQSYGLTFEDYTRLHQWSIENQTAFWESIAHFFNVNFDTPYEEIYVPAIPFWKTKWFRGAKLSYAHHVFRNATSSIKARPLTRLKSAGRNLLLRPTPYNSSL
jgi:acetoacetyl-CoA synthetase